MQRKSAIGYQNSIAAIACKGTKKQKLFRTYVNKFLVMKSE